MAKRAVFTGCDSRFLPGAAATVRSLRRHHPEVDVFCFVPPELVASAAETLGDWARVISSPREVQGVPSRSQMKFVRLLMTHWAEYDSVLWLDSDVVVCQPISELFVVAPGRVRAVGCHPANRVPHVLPPVCRAVFQTAFPKLATVPGYNTGVLAFRPTDWTTLVTDVERLIARIGFDISEPFGDQALLNAIFDGVIDPLPFEYNWTEMFDRPPDPVVVRLVHFCSRPKPWEPGYPKHEPGYWFWVKHGLGETDPEVLRAVRRKILLHTPRRLLGRLFRKVWPKKQW